MALRNRLLEGLVRWYPPRHREVSSKQLPQVSIFAVKEMLADATDERPNPIVDVLVIQRDERSWSASARRLDCGTQFRPANSLFADALTGHTAPVAMLIPHHAPGSTA